MRGVELYEGNRLFGFITDFGHPEAKPKYPDLLKEILRA